MDATRRRRTRDEARRRWYGRWRQERFARSAFRPGEHQMVGYGDLCSSPEPPTRKCESRLLIPSSRVTRLRRPDSARARKLCLGEAPALNELHCTNRAVHFQITHVVHLDDVRILQSRISSRSSRICGSTDMILRGVNPVHCFPHHDIASSAGTIALADCPSGRRSSRASVRSSRLRFNRR